MLARLIKRRTESIRWTYVGALRLNTVVNLAFNVMVGLFTSFATDHPVWFGVMTALAVVLVVAAFAMDRSARPGMTRATSEERWAFCLHLAAAVHLSAFGSYALHEANFSETGLLVLVGVSAVMPIGAISASRFFPVAVAYTSLANSPLFVTSLFVGGREGYAYAFGWILISALMIMLVKRQSMDFREHERICQKVNQERDRLQMILDGFPGLVSCLDESLRYVAANRQLMETLGLSEDDFFGRPLGFQEPESVFADVVRDFARSSKTTTSVEIALPGALGLQWFLLVLNRFRDGDEQRIVVITIDIKDRKLAEKQLAEQRELNLTAAKLASLGEMASGMAYEICAPLQNVARHVAELEAKTASEPMLGEATRNYTGRIAQAAKRIDNIVHSLLIVSHESLGEEARIHDIAVLLENALSLWRVRFSQNAIDLDVGIEGHDFVVRCRDGEIARVLLALLNNAYDAVKGREAPKIAVRLHDAAEAVVIDFIDDGPGVPADLREKIFEPFFTTKPVGSGLGLGLYTARAILDRHGGSLALSSIPGQTTFTVRLPKATRSSLRSGAA